MEERLALRKRPADLLLVVFFIIHLPITVLVDCQMLFPKRWFPAGARQLAQWHVDTNGDYLMRDVPPFFRALVACEIFLQIPFHIALLYAFITGKQWGRMIGIIYGVHTATTMVPILGDILASQEPTRNTLLAIYIPYLVIPLLVVGRLIPYTDPFATPVQNLIHKKTS